MGISEARIKLRRGTEAEWDSANPTLLAGEIGIVTDKKYFKIGDGTTSWEGLYVVPINFLLKSNTLLTVSTFFNSNISSNFSAGAQIKIGDDSADIHLILQQSGEGAAHNSRIRHIDNTNSDLYFQNDTAGGDVILKSNNHVIVDSDLVHKKPVSLGDFDISSTNQTLSLDIANELPIGGRARVSWFNGDGSNTFRFTGTGYTIDGIDPTTGFNWQGDATGYLDLVKVSDKVFETFGQDIWDSGIDAFPGTTSIFRKYVDGRYELIRSATITSYPTAISFLKHFAEPPKFIGGVDNSSVTFNIIVQNITATGGDMFVRDVETSTNITTGIVDSLSFVGKWTTDGPRRK